MLESNLSPLLLLPSQTQTHFQLLWHSLYYGSQSNWIWDVYDSKSPRDLWVLMLGESPNQSAQFEDSERQRGKPFFFHKPMWLSIPLASSRFLLCLVLGFGCSPMSKMVPMSGEHSLRHICLYKANYTANVRSGQFPIFVNFFWVGMEMCPSSLNCFN